jgi:hypothetical protein
MDKLDKQEQQRLSAYGLTSEEAEKAKDILPTYDLGMLGIGQQAEFKILDAEPKTIEAKSKYDPRKTTAQILNVYDKAARMNMTIWLSSKSLAMEFWKLAQKHNGSLKNLDVVIAVRSYEHEQYGSTRAYTVQETLKK